MDNETKKTSTRTTKSGTKSTSSATKTSSTASKTTGSSRTSSTTKSTKTTPASNKEKLEKSLKGLSFAGSGVGSTKIDTSKDLNTASNTKDRKKVGGVVLDMETIQDASQQKLSGKGNRRNNVIIIVLSLLLIISLVYLAIAIAQYNQSKKEPNCRYDIVSDVDARWMIDGRTNTKFVVGNGLEADTILTLQSELQINTLERVDILLKLDVKIDGENFIIAGLDGINDNLIRVEGKNEWKYRNSYQGGGLLYMFGGIDFSGAPSKLNSKNVSIKVTATITNYVAG